MVLGLIFNYKFRFSEVLWSFSIFLEAVAILPQLFLLQRTGEAETITTHYLAALGGYRAIRAAGLQISKDISVAGFDDLFFS